MRSFEGYVLIESPMTEGDEQFLSMAEDLLRKAGIVRSRSDWTLFSAGSRFQRNGTDFIELVCAAGSAIAKLLHRAGSDGGLPRSIIFRGTRDGLHLCWEIRNGIESEFGPEELRAL